LTVASPDSGPVTVAQVGPHDLIVQTVVEKKALLGGTRREESVQALSVPVDGDIVALRLDGRGDDLVIGTSRGQLVRYDMRDRGTPTVVETATVGAAPVTALSFLIRERTLVAADATAAVSSCQVVPPQTVGPPGSGSRPAASTTSRPSSASPRSSTARSRARSTRCSSRYRWRCWRPST